MSTHNICFPKEIRKILSGFSLLSGAMGTDHRQTTVEHTNQDFHHSDMQ